MGQTCQNDYRFSFCSLLSFCFWRDCPDDVLDYTGFRSLSCHFIMSFLLISNFFICPTFTADTISEIEMRKRHTSLLTSSCPLPFPFLRIHAEPLCWSRPHPSSNSAVKLHRPGGFTADWPSSWQHLLWQPWVGVCFALGILNPSWVLSSPSQTRCNKR